MEETKRKSIFKNKKIMIPVISIISIVLVISIILSVLYIPRKLTTYIHCKSADVQEMYITIREKDKFIIEEKDYDNVLEELKKIRVRPMYFDAYKGRTTYKLHIETKQDQYEIDGFYIKVNQTFHDYDMLNMDLLDDLIYKYTNNPNLN